MSAARRRALLEVVKQRNAFIVEDDFARDLQIDVTPPALVTAYITEDGVLVGQNRR